MEISDVKALVVTTARNISNALIDLRGVNVQARAQVMTEMFLEQFMSELERQGYLQFVCDHCGKFTCDCATRRMSLQSPDLVTDPRAVQCLCGQFLYPGQICSCI